MEFKTSSFSELSMTELHDIFQLRAEVFVVEQECVYQDIDGLDALSKHVLLYENGQLAAYSRILPPGLVYDEIGIGRVVVRNLFRKRGLGLSLMKYSINKSLELFGNQSIVISAQCYLLAFYSLLGFNSEGEQYEEDNIPHIRMRLEAPANGVQSF